MKIELILPEYLVEMVDKLSKTMNRSRTAIIAGLIEMYVPRHQEMADLEKKVNEQRHIISTAEILESVKDNTSSVEEVLKFVKGDS